MHWRKNRSSAIAYQIGCLERGRYEVQGNKTEPIPSKYPAKYRIDLHIDDDVSVLQNGKRYGFKVYLVGEQDDDWAKNIGYGAKYE